jgi:hypothetical protein
MAINLNDASFDAKEVSIFNDGNAGIVDNVTMTVEKKGADDKDNAPDYKLIFTDASGSTINLAYWYIDSSREYAEQNLKKQGKALKHLIHCYKGEDFSFPEFKDEKDMLDKCMKILKEAKTEGKKVRIYTNYGTEGYEKQYIQVRSFVPFIESMKVAIEDTRLKKSSIEVLERMTADVDSSSSSFDSEEEGTDEW